MHNRARHQASGLLSPRTAVRWILHSFSVHRFHDVRDPNHRHRPPRHTRAAIPLGPLSRRPCRLNLVTGPPNVHGGRFIGTTSKRLIFSLRNHVSHLYILRICSLDKLCARQRAATTLLAERAGMFTPFRCHKTVETIKTLAMHRGRLGPIRPRPTGHLSGRPSKPRRSMRRSQPA